MKETKPIYIISPAPEIDQAYSFIYSFFSPGSNQTAICHKKWAQHLLLEAREKCLDLEPRNFFTTTFSARRKNQQCW